MNRFEPRDTRRARTLRNNATHAEVHLWRYLQQRQLGGFRFTRQKQIGPYFVDFLCRERRLIVELDGSQHEERTEQDQRRTRFLESEGYTVLRFWNGEATDDTDRVLARILQTLEALPARFSSPPARGRGPRGGSERKARARSVDSGGELEEPRFARPHPHAPLPQAGGGDS